MAMNIQPHYGETFEAFKLRVDNEYYVSGNNTLIVYPEKDVFCIVATLDTSDLDAATIEVIKYNIARQLYHTVNHTSRNEVNKRKFRISKFIKQTPKEIIK